MSITIHKKSEATAEVAKAATAEMTEITKKIDEFGANFTEMASIKDHLKQYEKVHKPLYSELQTHVDSYTEADQERTLNGEKYAVQFKAHGNMGKVTDAHKAFELLEGVKKGLAWELMSFGLVELGKYLTPDQFEQVTEYEAKKARQVSVIELES